MSDRVHHLVRDVAAVDPGRIALRFKRRTLSYGELWSRAEAVAAQLAIAGITPGDRVGVLVPKSPEAVVAILGALRSGAVYVPMDAAAPLARNVVIARDCAMAAVVAPARQASDLLGALGEHAPRVALAIGDDPLAAAGTTVVAFGESGDAAPPDEAGFVESDPAAIVYTPGPGGPVGVTVTHGALRTTAGWFADAMRVLPGDRLAVHPPLHFSLSVYGLWPAFRAGAAAVLFGEDEAGLGADLARVIEEEGVTIWISAPFALALLARSGGAPSMLRSLRTVVFGGARVLGRDIRPFWDLLPGGVDVWQFLGSTEALCMCRSRVERDGEDDRPVPIGAPLDHVDLLLLTDDGRAAEPGETGEMYVRSPTLTSGYWGRPELTRARMVPDPLDPGHGVVFRSGDRLRRREDGTLEFAGRRDQMVKTRGSRVELAEVEAEIVGHPDVQEAVVVAVPQAEWGTEIIALVVPAAHAALTEPAIRAQVAKRLPRYMVPTRVEFAEALPRDDQGLVDRGAIAAMVHGTVLYRGRPQMASS